MSNKTAPPVPDKRPKTLRRDVRLACEGVAIVALSVSIEFNVYDHLKYAHMPALLGWSAGFAVPFIVALLSHVAAHVNFHWTVKIWVGLIVSVLMYVSASSGTTVLEPGMKFGPALGTSGGMDAAALTTLGILMFNATAEAALAAWEARQADLRRLAELNAEDSVRRAEVGEMLASRGGGNAPGNTGSNSRNNTGSNTPQGPSGNTQQPPGGPVPPAAGPLVTSPADDDGEDDGTEDNVTPIRARRAPMSDEAYRKAAWEMADELEADGQELKDRAFRRRWGGSPNKTGPIVKEVNSPANVAERRSRRDERARLAAVGE